MIQFLSKAPTIFLKATVMDFQFHLQKNVIAEWSLLNCRQVHYESVETRKMKIFGCC